MARGLVQVEGARELRRTMKQAGEDFTDLKTLHAGIGAIVANRGADMAPKRSGALAASVRASAAASSSTVRAGFARLRYAGPIHWGWPTRNIAPQPFLTDAAQQTEAQWIALYETETDKILSRIHGK